MAEFDSQNYYTECLVAHEVLKLPGRNRFKGYEAYEAELHDVFSDDHASGEWFEYSNYIDRALRSRIFAPSFYLEDIQPGINAFSQHTNWLMLRGPNLAPLKQSEAVK